MPESERTRAAHLQLLAVSWNFGWPVAAGVALGYWIDETLGSSPAATLVLGIGAMAAATWRLLNLSKAEQQARRADEALSPGAVADPPDPASRPQRWDDETEQWIDDDSEDDSRDAPS